MPTCYDLVTDSQSRTKSSISLLLRHREPRTTTSGMSTLDGLVQQKNDPQIMDFWVDFEKKTTFNLSDSKFGPFKKRGAAMNVAVLA